MDAIEALQDEDLPAEDVALALAELDAAEDGDHEDVEDDQSPRSEDTAADFAKEDPPPLFALGDIECATSSQTDWVNRYACDLVGGDFCNYTTGTTNYQTDWFSGEKCQPYLTVKTQTTPTTANYPLDLQYYAFYMDPLPTNKSGCERATLELAAYYFDDNGGGWHQTGTQVKKGKWNGSSCSIGYAKIDRTMTCNSLGKCRKAQAVSARAYVSTFFFPSAKRVHAGIFRTD